MSEKFCDECGLPFAEREELHGRIVLARKEAEAAGSMMLDLQQDSIALRADRDALVRVLRILNKPIAVCAYPGYEKDVAYSRVLEMREAVDTLSQKLRDLIGGEDG